MPLIPGLRIALPLKPNKAHTFVARVVGATADFELQDARKANVVSRGLGKENRNCSNAASNVCGAFLLSCLT
jgi:hypothetical protein